MSEETPRCLVRDDQGNDACDRPAEFIVWGHLYEKREKGPRCERHLPEGAYFPGAIGQSAIYRIPATLTVTAEQIERAARKLWENEVHEGYLGSWAANAETYRRIVRANVAALGFTVEGGGQRG